MDFRILGPLEVRDDADRPLELGGRKQRALLAVLLLHANRVLSSDSLIAALWGDSPPETAATALQGYVSGLRKGLAPSRPIVTRAPGYLVELTEDELDLNRFERLVEGARRALNEGDPARAVVHLGEGLALWRGPPLGDLVDEPFARVELLRLEEMRLAALEERIEAELALGRHAALVGELETYVRQQPLRERSRAQLMLALYRSGRQAEALAAYREARSVLVDELGIEPSRELQELEQAILRQDPALDLPTASVPEPRREPEVAAACPGCGQTNPKDSRFCGSCGADLVGEGAREVRKTVTILFADVSGSTTLGERLDPESYRQVLAQYFDVARRCIERHGGTVEKFIGDAVMAVFGVPTVHEDDALRALRAAAELHDELAALNDRLERDYGASLRLRIGVNTGEVVSGTEERLATGDAVNVAARLEQAAQPGEILIGEQTHRLARDAVEVAPVAPLALKGKAKPVVAHRLLRVVEGAPAFARRLDASLVGRREELDRVLAAFHGAVSERRCRLVTVLGPPGIGKSRLAREVATELAPEATVLAGRCLPYGEGITYWPLVEIFREARAEDELEAALSAGASEEIFWSVRKALERRSRESPLALVVEDIHWAEPTLLDLITHVADWTRDAPLLVLCTARPEVTDARPGWAAEAITLEPLSGDDSDRLIDELLGDAVLESTSRARICEVAEGNPLFVEQLLAMLAEGGDLDQIPPTMRALLAARLDALPDDEREVIERAAVVGHDFEWEALGELSPSGRRPGGALLATLVRKELIRPHEAIEDTFRFRHILIRDAAYERIPKALRAELHERFADWLDGRGEEFEEIVGYHLEQAHRLLVELGLPVDRSHEIGVRAAAHLAASGRRAYRRGDMTAAAGLLQRAAALLPRDDQRRLSILPVLGRALFDTGAPRPAEAVLAEALEAAREAGLRTIATDAAVELATVRLHIAPQELVGQGEVWRELGEAIPFYEESGDEAGLARALCVSGNLRFWRGENTAAIEDHMRAARHARNAGESAVEVESLQTVLLSTLFGPTPVVDALARVQEIAPVAERNRPLRVHVLRVRAQLEAMRENFAVARDLVKEAFALAEELGVDLTLARVAMQAGPVELLAGDPGAAERHLRPASEALERMQHWGYLSSTVPLLGDALLEQGRGDEALPLIELGRKHRVPEDVDAQVGWRRVTAKVLARSGELGEAERLALEATQIADRTEYLDLRAHAHADLADVLRLADKLEESRSELSEAIRLYAEKGNTAAIGRLTARELEPGAPA